MRYVDESREVGTKSGRVVTWMRIICDTLADLPAPDAYDGITICMGSQAFVIADGSKHVLQSGGQWVDITENDGEYRLPPATSNSLGGIMVGSGLTIDSAGMLSGDFSALWDSIYQTEKHLTGVPPLSFMASGNGIEAAVIYGNGQQQGTPAPGNPVMPTFCGTLDGTDWKIPITCAGQTVPVYLGQVQTVRRIKKLVLTGDENYTLQSVNEHGIANFYFYIYNILSLYAICTHLKRQSTIISQTTDEGYLIAMSGQNASCYIRINSATASTAAELKAYLAAQYAAGTPVTVWYVLAEPETAIVNEPLAKIGDYADELHSTDAGISIQTVRGQNTLTIGTTLQPSKISITYF